MPTTKAMTPATLPNVPTYAYLTVEPSVIGTGQQLQLDMWLYNIPPFNIAGSILFQGYTVTVTLPDKTTATLGPFTSDDIASAFTTYIPTETGNYSFVFSFPGQQCNNTYGLVPPGSTPTSSTQTFNEYYEPSTSVTVVVAVQSAPISQYPYTPPPQPTAYWQAPIEGNSAMYGWAGISGDWLSIPALTNYFNTVQYGNSNPYSNGPLTSHVIWRMQVADKGQVGGGAPNGGLDYYTGSSYEELCNNKIIMDGNLYFNLPNGNNPTGGGAVCIDLATGQQLWWKNIILTCGQEFDYESPNQAGVIGYLWGMTSVVTNTKYYNLPSVSNTNPVTYTVYDPTTGDVITQFTNGLYGRYMTQQNGELDAFFIGAAAGNTASWIAMWNSTLCFLNNGMIGYSETTGINGQWRPEPPGAPAYVAGTSTTQFPPFSWNWMNGMQFNTTVAFVPNLALAQVSPSIVLAVGYNTTSLSPTQNSANGPGWIRCWVTARPLGTKCGITL